MSACHHEFSCLCVDLLLWAVLLSTGAQICALPFRIHALRARAAIAAVAGGARRRQSAAIASPGSLVWWYRGSHGRG